MAEFLPLCERKGISIIIGGPYNSGILAGGNTFNYVPATAEMLAHVARVKAVCDRHGVDLKAAALQFPMAHPTIATTIPGAKTPSEFAENLRLFQTSIPAALWADLRAEGLIPGECPIPNETKL